MFVQRGFAPEIQSSYRLYGGVWGSELNTLIPYRLYGGVWGSELNTSPMLSIEKHQVRIKRYKSIGVGRIPIHISMESKHLKDKAIVEYRKAPGTN